jgi:tetratricopeptide (TPR) repeat protein
MELGVRLAVSDRGAVHVVERRWTAVGGLAPRLQQVARLERMFTPLVYERRGPADVFERAAAVLATRKSDAVDEMNVVHRIVVDALNDTQPGSRPVYEELATTADALHHPKQGRIGAPQILFHRGFHLKRDSEHAALEHRIAAWLYLDMRLKAGEKSQDDAVRKRYVQLGRAAVQGLYARAGKDDQELARFIQGRLKETLEGLELVAGRIAQAEITRSEGDAARKQGDETAAVAAFTRGVAFLNEALEVLNGPPWNGFRDNGEDVDTDVVNEAIEALGARGGLLKRLGNLAAARASYEEGARHERRFQLASTYNRLNAVKCAIRLGDGLAPSLPAIREVANSLDETLSGDSAAAERGWTWSDLADCRALLGELDEAATAYQRFIDLSQTQSPGRALQELRDLQAELQRTGDPGAVRVDNAIALLNERLQAAH